MSTAKSNGATHNGGGSGEGEAFVGVDVGGTHTDVQVIMGSREARGKALTTYDDFSRGVLSAVGVAAENLGVSLEELLGSTQLLVNATTVVTNSITQLSGAEVGIVVTRGFRDEFRFAGGPRIRNVDDHVQTNVPDIVKRANILEVEERTEFSGAELVPLNEEDVLEAARVLVEENGVSAIAICFLSSYSNGDHEQQAAELIEAKYPEIFVTPSHRVSSVRGEYPRWMTAVLNCFVHEHAKGFLNALGTKLHEAGLRGSVAFFQGLGGGVSQGRAEQLPLTLLGAGPAGGATGANELARRMGHDRVLLGDMGGTSFDTGLIYDNVVHIEKDVKVGRFKTSLPLVDVISVGAGGGSIAWISERGVPQVGPQSAGSTPGPAAYNNGGTDPTVTDAMIAMGLIDPGNYLGGRVELRSDLAEDALRRFGEPMGWGVEEAAAAVHDLVVTNMANAVREVSVSHGYDPREFVFYAYGGTMPWFAAEIANVLGIGTVLIPHSSSVFCARGLLVSDYVLRNDQTLQSTLDGSEEVARVNQVARELVAVGEQSMREEGFSADSIEIARSGDFQFAGQVHALPMALPDRELSAEDVPGLKAKFNEVYERTYGKGTAWPDAPPQMLNYSVTVTGKLPRPSIEERPLEPSEQAQMLRSEREVYLPTERSREVIPVYDETKVTPGSRIEGPALVEAVDTTLFVPRGVSAERDQLMNIVLSTKEA
jgi:N-methylhydantoinase A